LHQLFGLADGRFRLPPVPILGDELRWPRIAAEDVKEKRLIGDLWVDRSKGRGLFLMIENREFGRIDRAISDA